MKLGKVLRIQLVLFGCGLVGAAQAVALEPERLALQLERTCNCVGYAKTNGFQNGNTFTWLEDAFRFAAHVCKTGQAHPDARPGESYTGGFCEPSLCPSGTIDLGVSVRNCHAIKKSRKVPGGLPQGLPDNFAPSEGGCNYNNQTGNQSIDFISCDLACERVRVCATATS